MSLGVIIGWVVLLSVPVIVDAVVFNSCGLFVAPAIPLIWLFLYRPMRVECFFLSSHSSATSFVAFRFCALDFETALKLLVIYYMCYAA